MSDRPGKSRPMPAAPFDDPSIPVLTERLTLPALELDVSLPKVADGGISSSAPTPVPSLKARDEAPPPVLLGSEFATDDWLVETIPLAPAPIDLSSFDLPPLDLPDVGLVPTDSSSVVATPPAAAARQEAVAPVAAPLGSTQQISAEPSFGATDMLIPASLIRVPGATSTAAPANESIESAPTFDRLPPVATTEALPALETPLGPAAAFAVGQSPVTSTNPTAHWTQLEIELRESILRDLMARLPAAGEPLADAHLTATLESIVASATTQFAAQLRKALSQSLHDLVERAVKDELARLRELKH